MVHAAGESTNGPVSPGTYAVVLEATTAQLEGLEDKLKSSGLRFAAIRENDEPYNGELLALGIAPQRKSLVRPLVSSYPLLR